MSIGDRTAVLNYRNEPRWPGPGFQRLERFELFERFEQLQVVSAVCSVLRKQEFQILAGKIVHQTIVSRDDSVGQVPFRLL